MSAGPDNGFGVYIHWPFCTRICPYCDFNVYRDRGADAAQWTAALIRELEYWAARTPGRRLTGLYFGGGTPSLAPAAVIDAVIDAGDRLWGFVDEPEITLEANPTSAEVARFSAFRSAGINRLSLGVQSLDDASLKFLGREHDAADAIAAVELALSTFPRATADLIYARPGQTSDQWADELLRLIATGLRHVSLYQLTIEAGTAFERAVAKKRWAPANEDLAADLFDATQELTAQAGLPAYEVSNHAAPGEESRHNLIYWRQGDYIGAGPGAHGRVTIDGERFATETARRPAEYLKRIRSDGSGVTVNEKLSYKDVLTERLAMGLRTLEGVALTPAEWAALEAKILKLSASGLAERRGERLVASADGRRLLNLLLSDLAP